MNVRRGGLGRGLGALIPTGPEAEDGPAIGARFEEVPVELIDRNPKQPREVFDEDALQELVTSIREVGVLQPVVVREVDGGRYQLIMGERRLRASKRAGLERVPAIVRDTSDEALLRDALLENLHREQLNPLEEAAAYQQLLQEFGATHEELADRIGRSRSHVSNTLRLLQLSPPVQRRVAAGVISAGHARALLVLDRADEQDALAGRIVAEGLSVRAVEEIVTAPSVPVSTGRQRRFRPSAPELEAVAATLANRLETRVRIDLGKRRGKLTIEFANAEDLTRIIALLNPSDGVEPGEPMGLPAGQPPGATGAFDADVSDASDGDLPATDEERPAAEPEHSELDHSALAHRDGIEQHGEAEQAAEGPGEPGYEHGSGEYGADGHDHGGEGQPSEAAQHESADHQHEDSQQDGEPEPEHEHQPEEQHSW